MAKYRGRVGFVLTRDNQETGIVEEHAIEKTFYGRVLQHKRNWQSSDMVTDDLKLGNQIAIVATDYAFTHASAIRYCEYMGQFWKVTGVSIRTPEITMMLGGVYDGQRPAGSSGPAVHPCP